MKYFLFLLLMFPVTCAFSQQSLLKGSLYDSSRKQFIADATITLLKQNDSSLVSFTMSDTKGRFEISSIAEGAYRLLITHVAYHSRSIPVTIDKNVNNDLGSVFMIDISIMLSEVVVSNEAPPVSIIGDTIQYNAGSFKVTPNAAVEDLLKKLPGLKVEKDGTVKAQGEKVQRVLVDGKEFFGNDPKVATKNLPADAIDKVQVYDRLSDQAQMTGFDDGNSEKTINLKLKKDRKKGMFGKATGAMGTDERFEGKVNLNSFKGARQMSILGMGNNINAEGFSFIDILNFTGALSNAKNNGGNISISLDENDPMAGLMGGNTNGINTTAATGINYNNIIGNKTDWQSNLLFSHYNPQRSSEVRKQYLSPVFFSDQFSNSDNRSNSLRFNFSADHRLDSFHSIKVSGNTAYQDSKNFSETKFNTVSEGLRKINSGTNINQQQSYGYSATGNVLLRKKFRKRGRTFSLALSANISDGNGSGNLKNSSLFFDEYGNQLSGRMMDQQNNLTSKLESYSGKVVYTEPIFRKSSLELSASRNSNKNYSEKFTYDYNSLNRKYDLFNDSLSNVFESDYRYTTYGIRFRKKSSNFNYSLGVNMQNARLDGNNRLAKDSTIERRFENILPSARFQYYFSRSKNIALNYSAYTTQPTITQLQPVADISNPLSISTGNPLLKQEYTHALRVNGTFVNPFRNKNFFFNISYQATRNKIVNSSRISSTGVDTMMPVNVNKAYALNSNINYSIPVKWLKGSFDISAGFSQYQNSQFLNLQENVINAKSFSPQITFYFNPVDKINLSMGASYSFSTTKYSLSALQDVKSTMMEYTFDFNWDVSKKIIFTSDIVYRINRNNVNGFDTKVPVWNASVSKLFLKLNRGQIKLSVNDILKENLLVSRSTTQNYIEDKRVKGLQRYGMLSFTYNLSKTGLAPSGGGSNIRIMR